MLKRKTGDVVNLENDIVGKYVERLLGIGALKDRNEKEKQAEHGLTMEFLESCGI